MNIFKFISISLLLFLLLFIFVLVKIPIAYAVDNSFVTVVNPIRGQEFWDLKDQNPSTAVEGQMQINKELNIPTTWLVRFDALTDSKIVNLLQSSSLSEVGLFLEITPAWTKAAGVNYQKSESWHSAGSAFLTGYTAVDREKLIDTSFESFKKTFGNYPKSVGAWYIDGYSLDYMQRKYGILAALIVADQYTTDNYQIWGQYWSTPYYPSLKNTLIPAHNKSDKLPVVITQWAARDPLNGYGKGVEESTFSVQPNDYIDYHQLQIEYFAKLVDIYTTQNLNQFGQITVGLENSYSWNKYKVEYRNQMKVLNDKRRSGQFTVVTMKDFASWYQAKFTNISPPHIIVASDTLGRNYHVVWFMNPYYRVGWFSGNNGVLIKDVRQYIEGEKEICYDSPCQMLNFATFAARVLDDVTYGTKIVLDPGKANGLTVKSVGENFVLSYKNDAGRDRQITYMPRDISIDGKISSIDSLILEALSSKANTKLKINNAQVLTSAYQQTFLQITFGIFKFVLFMIVALFIPGYLLVRHLKQTSFLLNVFLSICLGIVNLTLVSFLVGYLKISWVVIFYIVGAGVIYFIKGLYKELKCPIISVNKISLLTTLIITTGAIFQSLAMIRSGWVYDFGMGFLGPLGHDGIWHQALTEQLIKNIPPQNPIFAGYPLYNYHYFSDLLVASTNRLSFISVTDLLYRFYPVLFSVLLGVGTYCLIIRLWQNKIAALISLYFVYFAGSFGWVVTYIKEKNFAGESAFWVNQPVSMNLNPPFAVSLVLVIAVILMFHILRLKPTLIAGIILVLLAGSLAEFKVYAGVIVLGGLLITSLLQIITTRNFLFLKVFLPSLILTGIVFLPQNKEAGQLLVWSPFWFIHSMVDFPDRVGWVKLSAARLAYFERGEWFKYILAEALALAMFIIGNLGMRFIALLGLISLFKQKFWKIPELSFIIWLAVLSFIIPVFFIQQGNPWNTIQFMYYFVYFIAIFAGVVLIAIAKKIPKVITLSFLILIILVTPISAWATFRSYLYKTPPSSLSTVELEALNFLKGQPEGVVMTYPYDKNLRSKFDSPYPLLAYETSAYVAAFSGKPTYVEDEIQNNILQTDYVKRLVVAKDLFNNINVSVLQNNVRIDYIYLPKVFNIGLDTDKLNLSKIFENQEVLIYKMNR